MFCFALPRDPRAPWLIQPDHSNRRRYNFVTRNCEPSIDLKRIGSEAAETRLKKPGEWATITTLARLCCVNALLAGTRLTPFRASGAVRVSSKTQWRANTQKKLPSASNFTLLFRLYRWAATLAAINLKERKNFMKIKTKVKAGEKNGAINAGG
jgi:hypothetical protein